MHLHASAVPCDFDISIELPGLKPQGGRVIRGGSSPGREPFNLYNYQRWKRQRVQLCTR